MTQFEKDLKASILRTVAQAKQEGTVGMGLANLRMITNPPSYYTEGCPRGTNAQYYYAQLFEQVARATVPAFLID